MEWYVKSWPFLKQYIEQNPETFRNGQVLEVAKPLRDIVLFKNVEDAVNLLKPNSEALNIVQSNSCSVGDTVDTRKKLLQVSVTKVLKQCNGWRRQKKGTIVQFRTPGLPRTCSVLSSWVMS